MSRSFDVLVIGCGPAGMSAAICARKYGLNVLVVDDQVAPGGQIWRSVETKAETAVGELLGKEYQVGTVLTNSFRASGALYEPGTQVWQIEPEWQVFLSRAKQAERVQARFVLLATGAQERPAPFPGWTLPGVLTVGAAQILLKTSRHIPDKPVWIAGSGPLPLLYMIQLLRGKGRIAGWLDTSPSGGWRRGLPHVAGASAGLKDILKGLRWMRELQHAGFPIVREVTHLRAEGDKRLESIAYRTAGGQIQRVESELLLTHEGVIPNIHMTSALGCDHEWRDDQICFAPAVDNWGETSQPGIFSAGDGVGIGGARAACVRGELAALGIAARRGKVSAGEAQKVAAPLRRRLEVELSTRPLLDALYPPRAELFAPADETVICRCEEVTAGQIREAAAMGEPDPNQIKSMTRAGMGPCQGRQCGYSVAHILAAAQKKRVEQVGFFTIRPPLKPLTLGELGSLDIASESA